MASRVLDRVSAPRVGGGGTLLLVALVGLVTWQLPSVTLEAVAIGISFAAGAVCLVVARRARGRARCAWRGFAALLLLWGVADVLWALSDLGVLQDDVSVADLVYAAGVPGALVGILLLPDGQWERGARLRVTLDALVIAVPVLVVGNVLLLRQLADHELTAADTYLLVWPVADVLLTALAFVLVRRRARRMRPDLALVVLAFATWTVGDTWLASLALADLDYFGSAAQLPFLLAPLLLGLAALASPYVRRRGRHEAESGVRRHTTSRLVVVLPDLMVISAGVVCLVAGVQEWHEWALVGLGAGLAVLRQAVVAVDAQQARESLERRVEQRTHRLRSLSYRLETILGSVGDGIIGVSSDGRIGFVNPAAARLLGVGLDELLGQDVCDAVCPSHRAGCPLDVAIRVAHGPARTEVTFRRRSSGLVPVEVGVTRVGSEVEGDLGSVLVFHDVAARRAIEQAKQQFVSSVSHELRTPLTAIRGALEMLVDGDAGELPTAAVQMVDTAERGVGRLTRLVDDLLDVDRLASGSFSISPRPMPVAPLVTAVTESLRGWADSQGVTLVLGRLGGVALADADRIEQALVNLVGNAVKFSHPGSTVDLSTRTCTEAVEIQVRDHGRGIPAADLPHVFDRFHQVDEGDATEKGGTGLGLAITRSIVRRHGGEIWVSSVPGEGSTFAFTLPLAEPDLTAPPGPPAGDRRPAALGA